MGKKFLLITCIVFPLRVWGWQNCGNINGVASNCAYQVEDGVLTIRPIDSTKDAVMPNYAFSYHSDGNFYETNAPWFSSKSDINSVNIEQGIQNVGNCAFMSMNLTNVSLPDTLTDIAHHGFWETGITQIDIPDSVVRIGNRAFEHNSLSSVIIPDSVEFIEEKAFGDEGQSFEIFIGDGIKELSDILYSTSIKAVYCSEAKRELCINMLVSSTGKGKSEVEGLVKTYTPDGNRYILNGLRYKSLSDIKNGKFIKRIYTIDEANQVSKNRNTVKIRYK